MRNTPYVRMAFFTAVLLYFVTGAAIAQDSTKKSAKASKTALVRQLITTQRYAFKAQTMFPMSGRSRVLTSDYDLRVSKDTVISYLPYFGRAYSASLDPSDNGIQFTSVNFDYTVTEKKKGGWDIIIKPKDYSNVQQLSLSVSADGYASLQVTSTNRQSISFNGTIAGWKRRK